MAAARAAVQGAQEEAEAAEAEHTRCQLALKHARTVSGPWYLTRLTASLATCLNTPFLVDQRVFYQPTNQQAKPSGSYQRLAQLSTAGPGETHLRA